MLANIKKKKKIPKIKRRLRFLILHKSNWQLMDLTPQGVNTKEMPNKEIQMSRYMLCIVVHSVHR